LYAIHGCTRVVVSVGRSSGLGLGVYRRTSVPCAVRPSRPVAVGTPVRSIYAVHGPLPRCGSSTCRSTSQGVVRPVLGVLDRVLGVLACYYYYYYYCYYYGLSVLSGLSVVWSMWFVVGGLPVVSKLSSCCLGSSVVGGRSLGFALFTGGATARHPDLGLKGCPYVTRSVTPRPRSPRLAFRVVELRCRFAPVLNSK